tara:strand:+ start:8132 stop:8620 length:489 start_codon:yes stop_codon:yes gene_type:complete
MNADDQQELELLRLFLVNAEGMRWLPIPLRSKEDVKGKSMLEIAPYIREAGRYNRYEDVIRTGKMFVIEDIVMPPGLGFRNITVRAFRLNGQYMGLIGTDTTIATKMRDKLAVSLRDSEDRRSAARAKQTESDERITRMSDLLDEARADEESLTDEGSSTDA